jgi:hypothetical protein
MMLIVLSSIVIWFELMFPYQFGELGMSRLAEFITAQVPQQSNAMVYTKPESKYCSNKLYILYIHYSVVL